ncbi:DUF6447 family protein [Marinobacter sp. S6332]|uniref:DUF6447 family protein n=1 Tax=Marinobacter sp. S6332 TaxID=2926403 RepID=UPI001FF3B6CF|nr:DUF6447 family protein [Marinobacter sp. S6332]MCK0163720.1 DUF6447 family protein [Marinobacter sp. S6332]
MTDTKKTGAAPKPRKAASTKAPASKSTARKPATKAASKKPAQKTANKETITIDGKQYALDSLNDNAKAQITNIRATDRLIGELENELAITKTARQRYGEALEQELKATRK